MATFGSTKMYGSRSSFGADFQLQSSTFVGITKCQPILFRMATLLPRITELYITSSYEPCPQVWGPTALTARFAGSKTSRRGDQAEMRAFQSADGRPIRNFLTFGVKITAELARWLSALSRGSGNDTGIQVQPTIFGGRKATLA